MGAARAVIAGEKRRRRDRNTRNTGKREKREKEEGQSTNTGSEDKRDPEICQISDKLGLWRHPNQALDTIRYSIMYDVYLSPHQ
jgi:hypothetical protein